jgi:ribosomal protein S19
MKIKKTSKQLVISSSRIIDYSLINKHIKIHNGLLYNNVLVNDRMIGRIAGEFITTKRQGPSIHIYGRKNKKLKKSK